MSEVILVTKNDEPALAFGEYEISADGKTLYVGSAGVGDGSSETIYKGISPAQIKSGVFSKLPVITSTFNAKHDKASLNYVITVLTNNITKYINVKHDSATLALTKGE